MKRDPSRRPIGRRHAGRRGGFSLIEATVAVVLLMVGLATALQAVSWVLRDRRASDRRAVAIQEAGNLLERLATGGEEPAEPAFSPEGARALPGGSIEVDRVLEDAGGVPMRRITVTVRYGDQLGIPAAPVRLTTWVAPDSFAGDPAPGEGRP